MIGFCLVPDSLLTPFFLRLRKRSQSGGRAKAERRQSEGTLGRRKRGWPPSRPFPNAKIARINDMANFFEQKMSLSPFLKKRGSLGWEKRLSLGHNDSMAYSTKHVFFRFIRR